MKVYANHPYWQLRAKLNYEGRSSTWSSRRLSKGASGSHLMTHVRSRNTATVEGSIRGANPNPPCQLSLWEETGAPGENPRLSAERRLTLFTWVRTENRTHDFRGEKCLLWGLWHRSSLTQLCRQSIKTALHIVHKRQDRRRLFHVSHNLVATISTK